jgi:hypothetical protein
MRSPFLLVIIGIRPEEADKLKSMRINAGSFLAGIV